MSEERIKILTMLSEGKISVEESEKLLNAIGQKVNTDTSNELIEGKSLPNYFIVEVRPKAEEGDRVNVRIPFKLLRAGIKLGALMPKDVHFKVNAAMEKKGIDFDITNFKPEDVDELLLTFKDFSIDVDTENESVKIYCE